MTGRRALVISEPGSIALQDVPGLVPGPGEVVARPVHTGICGTDLELLAGVVDPAYVRYPLVPGHEWSGVIEAVGPGVTGLEPGQPVIAEGIIPDRICAECVQGHTNLCVVYDELGFTRAGAAADQVLLPAQVVHVLGGSADLLEAALAEPAAVAGGAGRGRRRRHAGPDHRAPAPPLLARRTDRLRAAPGPGRPGRRARRHRVHGRYPG
jgi:threonine dehydrogenase-like Zn-dependent dehydrogenase